MRTAAARCRRAGSVQIAQNGAVVAATASRSPPIGTEGENGARAPPWPAPRRRTGPAPSGPADEGWTPARPPRDYRLLPSFGSIRRFPRVRARRASARGLGAFFLAILALALVAGRAAAFSVDPTVIAALPPVPCGSPPVVPAGVQPTQQPDYWCGTWQTQPLQDGSGGASSFPPVGTITLTRVNDQAAVGDPTTTPRVTAPLRSWVDRNQINLGPFPFPSAPLDSEGCAPVGRALFYIGAYDGAGGSRGPGVILACTGNDPGKLLVQYQDQQPGAGPGPAGAITIQLSFAPVRFERANFVQYFSGTPVQYLSGTCTSGPCTADTPFVPPSSAKEGFLTSNQRDGVIGNTAFAAGGSVVACAVAIGAVGLNAFLNPASWAALPWSGQLLIAACVGGTLSAGGGGVTLWLDSIVARLRGAAGAHSLALEDAGVAPRRLEASGPSAAIVLPRARPVRSTGLGRRCRPGPSGPRCRALAALADRYLNDLGVAASLQETVAVGARRLSDAQSAGDGQSVQLQGAVIKVYLGQLADALANEHRSAVALAGGLRSRRLDIRLTRAQATRVAGLLARRRPAAVAARLRQDGLSAADVQGGFGVALGLGAANRPLSLVGALSRPVPVAGLRSAYHSISPAEIGAIVQSLAAQGALRGALAATLKADVATLEAAQGAARKAAVVRLRADAKRAPGRYGIILQLAANA